MKSANSSTFEYPLVVRKVMNEIVISCPDLGYWKSIPVIEIEQPLETAKSSKNEKVTSLGQKTSLETPHVVMGFICLPVQPNSG